MYFRFLICIIMCFVFFLLCILCINLYFVIVFLTAHGLAEEQPLAEVSDRDEIK